MATATHDQLNKRTDRTFTEKDWPAIRSPNAASVVPFCRPPRGVEV